MPERARAELNAALEPADDFPIGDHLRSGAVDVVRFRVRQFEGLQHFLDLIVGEGGAEIGGTHRVHGHRAAIVEVGRESGTEACAVVRRGRLGKKTVNHV